MIHIASPPAALFFKDINQSAVLLPMQDNYSKPRLHLGNPPHDIKQKETFPYARIPSDGHSMKTKPGVRVIEVVHDTLKKIDVGLANEKRLHIFRVAHTGKVKMLVWSGTKSGREVQNDSRFV